MDPVIWPRAVVRFAAAITVAEGSNPAWNNPGDLTYSCGFPVVGVVNSEGVLEFARKEDGEHALLHQCFLMLSGRSREYSLDMTIGEAGLKYSNRNVHWAVNVASELGVPIATTLRQLAEMEWADER